jgi:hypothetical protein
MLVLSQISLNTKHQKKYKDYQRREDEVANLLNTSIREIPTSHEKKGQHLFSKISWGRRSPSSK